MGAAEWHRALSRLLTARGGEEASASKLKEAALRAAGLYTARGAKGGLTGGKVRFPPVRHVHGFHQRTKRIPIGLQSTLCKAQGGNKETMNTANTGNTVNGLWQPVCHALWNFDSTGLCVLLAGKALCAGHRERAREYGLVRTCTDLYGRLAHGAVRAMRCGISIAQGCEFFIKLPAGNGLLPVPTEPCCILRPACKLLHGKEDR